MNPRRTFLQAAAGGILILKPQTVFGSQANSTVEVGIVGCGGRGNWIGKFFPEFTGARVVALADVIREHLDKTRDAFQVEASRGYDGPDAYRELAHSQARRRHHHDPAVLPSLARTGGRRRREARLSAPSRSLSTFPAAAASSKAAKSLPEAISPSWLTSRAAPSPSSRKLVSRIRRGDIGKPVLAQVFYYAGRPSKNKGTAGMDPGQQQVMNFLHG